MAETPAKSSTAADGVPAVDAPPLAPDGAPICYVVDEEPSIRHFLSLILHGAGVDTVEFPDGNSMRKAVEARPPALVFHNISLESNDAIESVIALGRLKYRGAVQLMSARGAAVLEHVKGIGAQHKLNMMPVLKKPFETGHNHQDHPGAQTWNAARRGALCSTTASRTTGSNSGINRKSLRKKQLAGAEARPCAPPATQARPSRRIHGRCLGLRDAQTIGAGAGKRAQDQCPLFKTGSQSAAGREYSNAGARQAFYGRHHKGAPPCRRKWPD